ncbi:MAG: hypothetical protein ACRCY8_12190 [Dermatophilaceae bacterium]
MRSASDPLPARVRVRSSRHDAALARARPVARDLDEQTELGDVYLDGLMRAQLRLSVAVIAMLVLGVAAVPLTYSLVPSAATWSVLGVPVAWLLLGAGPYPAAWLLARWYARQADRVEGDFADVVEPHVADVVEPHVVGPHVVDPDAGPR